MIDSKALLIESALKSYRYSYANEIEFQDGVAKALDNAFIAYRREVDLGPVGIIDFVVGTIGIEVKIKGARNSALRQIRRYAECEEIDGFILVSSKLSVLLDYIDVVWKV